MIKKKKERNPGSTGAAWTYDTWIGNSLSFLIQWSCGLVATEKLQNIDIPVTQMQRQHLPPALSSREKLQGGGRESDPIKMQMSLQIVDAKWTLKEN